MLGAILGSAAIGAIGSWLGGREQRKATDAGVAEARAAREQAFEALSPFREAGAQILPDLTAAALADPFDFNFERDQGIRGINNYLAAEGRRMSGERFKQGAEFITGLQARYNQNRVTNLHNLATLGGNAAAQVGTNALQSGRTIADLYTQGGNAAAAQWAGVANAANQGIGNYMYYNYLQGLPHGGGGSPWSAPYKPPPTTYGEQRNFPPI